MSRVSFVVAKHALKVPGNVFFFLWGMEKICIPTNVMQYFEGVMPLQCHVVIVFIILLVAIVIVVIMYRVYLIANVLLFGLHPNTR